jgi:hypothetical protein
MANVPSDPSLDADDPLGIEGADGGGLDGGGDDSVDQGDQGDQGAAADGGGKDDGGIEIVFEDTDPDGGGEQEAGAEGGEQIDEQHEAGSEGSEADAGAAGDDDTKRYGKNVRERIERERRVTARERAARENAERQATAAIRKHAEASFALAQVTERLLKGEINAAKAKLMAAKEAGKTEEEVEATAEMNRLQNRLAEVERAKPELEARAKAAREGKLGVEGRKVVANPLTEQWKARNKWFGDERFRAESNYAAMIDQELFKEGLDPNDPSYFTEWDRRIRERMPTLSGRWRQLSGQAPKGKGARPGPGTLTTGGARSAAPARSAAQASAAKGRVVITAKDKEFMRTLGMDPDKKEDLHAFASERLETMKGASR